MKVWVLGGRDYTLFEHRQWLYEALGLLNGMAPVTAIIEGGQSGFEVNARNWALWRHAMGQRVDPVVVEIERQTFGDGARAVQCTEMAKMRPDVVLVCPGADPTDVAIAKSHQLRVVFLEKMPVVGPPAAKRGPVPRSPQSDMIVDVAA